MGTSVASRRRSTWPPSSGWPALLAEAGRLGHLSAAHDLSDGGLAQALVEACLRRGYGAQMTLPDTLPPVRVAVQRVGRAGAGGRTPGAGAGVRWRSPRERGVPCSALGAVRSPNSVLAVEGVFEIPLDELREAHTATLPALFG